MANDETHAQVKFTTTLKGYSIEDTSFSLPTSAGCSELNSLLNSLIGKSLRKKPISFDFLINGEFLRATLHEFIRINKLPTESVIEIEYILKEDAPELSKSFLLNDWVTSIDTRKDDLMVLVGSYDNTISLWNVDGSCLSISQEHTMPVKSVSWICGKSPDNRSFITASHDQTIRLWEITLQNNGGGEEPKCVHVCRGHAGSVDCLAVHENVQKFASGSWDKMIKIWDSTINHNSNGEEDIENEKRAKANEENLETSASTRTPLITFSGHKEPVSSLVWSSENVIFSAGWDHSIRLWDVNTAVNTRTFNSNKAILNISYSHNNKIICTGSVDKFVRLYDTRLGEGEILKTSLSSHTGWVSSVAWSPNNENQLISGSYDCTVLLWDIRKNDIPILDLSKHQDKVMCVSWPQEDVILSGGADCEVHINRRQTQKSFNSEE